MNNRTIKFRVWDIKNKHFTAIRQDDVIPPEDDVMEIFREGQEHYLFQQFTGLKSKDGHEIYEGDIIEFKYWVGDFALMDMDDKEYKRQKKMINKKYIGVICPTLIDGINLEIRVGKENSTHIRFPLAYAQNSEIIGNIFENPELNK